MTIDNNCWVEILSGESNPVNVDEHVTSPPSGGDSPPAVVRQPDGKIVHHAHAIDVPGLYEIISEIPETKLVVFKASDLGHIITCGFGGVKAKLDATHYVVVVSDSISKIFILPLDTGLSAR